MAIVTISRQFGAPGRPVGLELARRMGAEFLDRQLVAAVATRAGISVAEAEDLDERVPSRWQRLAAALTVGVPDPVMPPVPASVAGDVVARGDLSAPDRLAALTRTVIEEAADRGSVVILGRGGAFVLKGRPDAVHVQLHADIDARVRSLVDRVAEIPVEEIPMGRGRTRPPCGTCAATWMPAARRTSGTTSGRTGSTPRTTTSRSTVVACRARRSSRRSSWRSDR